MAVTYMPGLSSFAADKLTCLYEKQLGSAHSDICIFKRDATKYFEESSNTKNKNIQNERDVLVPALFSSYLSGDLVELAESNRPATVFYRQLHKRLLNHTIPWEKLQLELHISVQQYRISSGDTSDGQMTIQQGLIETLNREKSASSSIGGDDDDTITDRSKTAGMLLLFGWEANLDTDETASKSSVSLKCQLCRKCVDVWLQADNEEIGDTETNSLDNMAEPPAKRSRQSGWDPLYSHRHYCPYVCGFPKHGASCGIPWWKGIADRVLSKAKTPQSTTTSTDDTSTSLFSMPKSDWEKVNQLLNSGIVRKRKIVDMKSN